MFPTDSLDRESPSPIWFQITRAVEKSILSMAHPDRVGTLGRELVEDTHTSFERRHRDYRGATGLVDPGIDPLFLSSATAHGAQSELNISV